MSTNNSWNNAIAAANSVITLNSGTNALSISSDASATTVSIATGAAAKAVTIGSTNSTSSLALKTGTADFSLASATGTIISALDTGEITYPLQSAFLAALSATTGGVTGAGTAYTVICDTEVFDQNADYNNTTGVFTAPITGRYALYSNIQTASLTASMTRALQTISTSNRTYRTGSASAGVAKTDTNTYTMTGSVLADMDAADTASLTITISNGTSNAATVGGTSGITTFSGMLAC